MRADRRHRRAAPPAGKPHPLFPESRGGRLRHGITFAAWHQGSFLLSW